MLYNDFDTITKKNITKVLNIKHKMVELQKEFEKGNARIFQIVKDNGSITKNGDKISYIAQGEDKPVFDLDKFSKENPQMYAKYLVNRSGAKEHLRYTLH